MRNFVTHIRLAQGNRADQSLLHTALSSDPSLSVELVGFRHKGTDLEIEYKTSGSHSIAELTRTFADAVDNVKKSSSFFIIRDKKI